ncbi:MAG TPA: hypothetical protein VE988_06340 [Gemmataceae bacterium]|nr:hypothetical protein [Gemmataceae bacterium]
MNLLQPKRIDRLDLLRHPSFWAVYYFDHQCFEDLATFGITQADFDAVRRELKEISDVSGWFACYSFELPLPRKCSVSVEIEMYPEDAGTTFYIHRAGWDKPQLLCRKPSELDWPPFRWDEVAHMANAVGTVTANKAVAQAALPLLFPGVWLNPNDNPKHVAQRLQSAWESLEAAKPSDLDLWVGTLVEHFLIGNAPVHSINRRDGEVIDRYQTFEWRYDRRLGWVNNSWSRRNPEHSPPEFFEKVKEFFDVIAGS